jgi:ribosomal protein S18 acetylase RimI-like enzyme
MTLPPSDRLTLRPAAPADSAAIAQVQVDNYRGAYAGLLPQAYLDNFTYAAQAEDWLSLLNTPQHDPVFVAERAGQVIGYALGRLGSPIPPYACELVALHVRHAHQGQGAGRQLIRCVAEHFQQQGLRSLMLWTLQGNPARRLYERLGGQLIGEQRVELGENIYATEVAYGWPDIAALIQTLPEQP